jgi:hypothetical protein
MPDAFTPLPTGVMCSMIYSGPQTARVTGTWDGRPVDTTFARNDGCATARWKQYRALFTDPRDVTVTGRVDLAPTCPVQQVGQDCSTKGAQATVTATSRDRTRQVPSGANGFRLRVPRGVWRITADAGMSCPVVRVDVRGSRKAPYVVIDCDTGIR